MIILRPYEPKIFPVVPMSEWREPSLSMPRNQFGHPEWRTRFQVSAHIRGEMVWRGWFDDRDDADAFLTAAVMRTLHIQRALCHLPDPIWSPGWYRDEDIVWQYAVTTYYTSGTSWTVPSDWNNSSNEIIAIGGGGTASQSGGAKAPYTGTTGAGGGACSKAVNQTYTASASRTRQIGGVETDTYLRADDNSTNAVLAKAGQANGNGGAAGSGVGSTKYSGGNGSSPPGGGSGGGAGGAASTTANGANGSSATGGTSGDGASAGANGTGLGSGYGSGGGGNGGALNNQGGAGGNYGGGGGGAGDGDGARNDGGLGKQGLLVVTHTPAAAGMKTGFNMPNGW